MALDPLRSLTSGEKYDAYARRLDGPMLALAFLFLIIWTVTSVAEGLPHRIGLVLAFLNGVIWIGFAADLVIRIVIAKSSWRFVVRHPLDLLSVLYPPLRPLKVLTVFTSGSRLVSRRGAIKTTEVVVFSALLLIWIGGVAVFNAEGGRGDGNITSIFDALWWAVVTVTTVGYGDFYPVTHMGRIVATMLMVVGISIIGVVTASVAAWFVRLTTAEEEAEDDERHDDLAERITRLEQKIDLLVERGDERQ